MVPVIIKKKKKLVQIHFFIKTLKKKCFKQNSECNTVLHIAVLENQKVCVS